MYVNTGITPNGLYSITIKTLEERLIRGADAALRASGLLTKYGPPIDDEHFEYDVVLSSKVRELLTNHFVDLPEWCREIPSQTLGQIIPGVVEYLSEHVIWHRRWLSVESTKHYLYFTDRVRAYLAAHGCDIDGDVEIHQDIVAHLVNEYIAAIPSEDRARTPHYLPIIEIVRNEQVTEQMFYSTDVLQNTASAVIDALKQTIAERDEEDAKAEDTRLSAAYYDGDDETHDAAGVSVDPSISGDKS